MTGRPPLALSLGDPAGIGPEIVTAAWTTLRQGGPVFAVLGDADLLAALGHPVARIADLFRFGGLPQYRRQGVPEAPIIGVNACNLIHWWPSSPSWQV